MKHIVKKIKELRNGFAGKKIAERMLEFRKKRNADSNCIFSEMCFCILTANYNAEKAIEIQEKIGNGFCELSEKKLASELKELGYRYPNKRAEYISSSKKHRNGLEQKIKENGREKELRKWLVKNVKGLGMKEASHFLRNIGFENVAIIDFHIIDLLERHRLIEKPKAMNEKNYLKIEQVLKRIGKTTGLSLAELDLYLWFIETGKILK
jgi:N-glycosylase/DNA lyase